MAQFVTRLRHLANLCKFGDHVDDFIRDQVIDNCRSKRLRMKLLAERDLKLEHVLDLAATMQASERQVAQMTQDAEQVNMVSGAGWRERQKQPKVNDRCASHDSNWCTKCYRRGHTIDACRCTQTAKCYTCGKTGHFSKKQAHLRYCPKHIVKYDRDCNSSCHQKYCMVPLECWWHSSELLA